MSLNNFQANFEASLLAQAEEAASAIVPSTAATNNAASTKEASAEGATASTDNAAL